MNHYEQLIADFLNEYKEVSLDRIGVIKTTGNYTNEQQQSVAADFTFNRKAVTSPELIYYIAQKTSKSRILIASDLESHLAQAREFINIGKTYEILNAGFIKKNNTGEYELIPASQAVKAQKDFSKPLVKKHQRKKTASSAVQFFTLLIVLVIIGGLSWEAYQFFVKKPLVNTATGNEPDSIDSTTNNIDSTSKKDTAVNTVKPIDTTKLVAQPTVYNNEDSANIKYIYETTNLLARAQARTAQLKSFGNEAAYDSTGNNGNNSYVLYIIKKTKIADTLHVKDSIGKFLLKPITIKISSNK